MSLDQRPGIDRRALLRALLALPSATALPGCSSLFAQTLTPVCPTDPVVSSPGGELTIDAHCHVFNGSDLQINEFLVKVATRQSGALGIGAAAVGPLLQWLGWHLAPDGDREIAALKKVADALRVCTPAQHQQRVLALKQEAYTVGRDQLQQALALANAAVPAKRDQVQALSFGAGAQAELARVIDALPADVETYESQKTGPMPAPGKVSVESLTLQSVTGVRDFLLRNFQYRYVNIYDYLRLYDQAGGRVVDLMIPSLVDYDFGLARGVATPTAFAKQVEVMRQLSIVTGGRVHAMAPFDPLRQVAFARGRSTTDSLSLIQDAVRTKGCLGVKLYPTMGFAAYANARRLQADGRPFWARTWLPEWMGDSTFGQELDDALDRLYQWAEQEDVPIMAHTALTNGASDDFEALAGSDGWGQALARHPNLRVSFGHFGDSLPVEGGRERAQGFTRLMKTATGATGSRAYADAGYFVDVLKKEPALRDILRELYEDPQGINGAPLANRFMYGTDWEMTVVEGDVHAYLTNFVELMDDLQSRPALLAQGVANARKNFFGLNAATWAGLHQGEPSRIRLEAFYAKTGVAATDWMKKLDATLG